MEKLDIINLSNSSRESCFSMIHSGSEVTFFEEEEEVDANFRLFFYYTLSCIIKEMSVSFII